MKESDFDALNILDYITKPFGVADFVERINKILVNAVGFGGNAVSVLLSK